MSPRPRLGICFVPTLPPESLLPLARVADEHLDDLWVWEDCFCESGIATASAALAATQSVRIGLGLMPAPLRNVALTAMEVATVQRLFPGRFVPGLGHGVQSWMAQVGGKVASPMTLLREQLTALRALLDGDEVSTDGRYVRLDGVQLRWPPASGGLLMSGGNGPKTLELAGELTDGTLLSAGLTVDELREAVAASERGQARAERRTAAHEVVFTLIAATGDGADTRLVEERQRWDKSATTDIGVAGGVREITDAVRRAADASATTVVIQPTADEPDLSGLVRLIGEVRSHL